MVADGRCTRCINFCLLKSQLEEYDYILVLDTEGI